MKKLKTMSPIVVVLLFSIFITAAQAQKIPITSSSEKAVQLYYQSWAAYENAEIANGNNLLNEALQEDPGFFMGHFTLAMNNLYYGNQAEFKSHAEKAVGSKAKLSREEKMLKSAMEKLAENPKANVTNVGRKLIELHPNDKIAYYLQSQFQMIIKDLDACLKTFNQLLEITDNPGPVYNMIGYTQMNLENYEAAEKAFDRYILLVPNHPNPYDSKGDYFMQVKDYPNAFLSYMKAYELDKNWSYGKAIKAKELAEKATLERDLKIQNLYNEAIEFHRQAEQSGNRKLDLQAEALFKEIMALDSANVAALVQLGWIHNGKETRNYLDKYYLDSAFYFVGRALHFDKESAPAYGLQGFLYSRKGMYDKALEAYQTALLFDIGEAAIYLNLSGLYFNMGDYPKGIEYCLKQMDHEKSTGANYWTLTNLYYQLCRTGYFTECCEFNTQLLKLNNDSTAFCQNLMFGHLLSGNFDSVKTLAINHLQLNPDDLNCKYFLGWTNLFQRNFEESYQWFNEAAKTGKAFEQQEIPNAGYGFVCLKKGFNEEADYHFNGAISNATNLIEANVYPELNLPHLTLASIYSAKGETEKALEQLRINKSHHLQALAMLKFNPMFDNIRNEPEFNKILADVETKYTDVHQRVGKLLAER